MNGEEDVDLLRRELQVRTLMPGLPVGAYAPLVELMFGLTLAEGAVLFSRAELADHIYFLVEGTVSMEHETEKPWVFEAPATIGVIDAMLGRPHDRVARVTANAKLLRLPVSGWFDLIEDNAQVARAMIRNFAGMLHRSFRELKPEAVPIAREAPTEFDASTYGKIVTLHHARFLEQAGMQAVASLALLAEPKRLAASEPLWESGQFGNRLHVVASGLIELAHADGFRRLYGEGELVGGPAALCNALPSYSARAVTESIVLCIPEQDYYDQAEEHARLTRGTLAYLASELETLLERGVRPTRGTLPPRT